MGDVPPPIPHVTQNYVGLQHLVTELAQRSDKELQETLGTLDGAPSDAAKKRQFLTFLVGCRQEFVKLYVLCKWAVVSPDISRCIDVASWLHGQQQSFNNAVAALFYLQQSLQAAQMPWADIETALEVEKFRRPLGSMIHWFAPHKRLSPIKVLGVMRRLNILLAVRVALTEHLPQRYHGFKVLNGRVNFSIPILGYWVELSVADDSTNGQFFFVDFGLEDGSRLPERAHARLEQATNERLSRQPLRNVLDWLSNTVAVYRLSNLAAQVSELEKVGAYAGALIHKFVGWSLSIQYWVNSGHSGEIIVGIRPYGHVVAKWRPNNKASWSLVSLGEQFDASTLLTEVTETHTLLLMRHFDELPWVRQQSNNSAQVRLGTQRTASLIIDPTSGLMVVVGVGHIDPGRPEESLELLRIEAQQDSIARCAQASGWQVQKGLRLYSGDLACLVGVRVLLALRRPEWAAGWCLCVGFGSAEEPQWVATRLRSVQRRWRLEFTKNLPSLSSSVDFSTFAKLSEDYMTEFALYELCRELQTSGVRHQRLKNVILVDIRTLLPTDVSWVQSALRLTVNTDHTVVAHGKLYENAKELEAGSDGEFKITVNSLGCLRNILRKYASAATSLILARSLNLEVLKADFNSIELSYAGGQGVLTIREGSHVDLPESNPQSILGSFLPALLAQSGFVSVVAFLAEIFPVFVAISRLNDCTALAQTASRVCLVRQSAPMEPMLLLEFLNRRGKPEVFITCTQMISGLEKYFKSSSQKGVISLRTGAAASIEACVELLPHMFSCLR